MKVFRKNLTIAGAVSALAVSGCLVCSSFASASGDVSESCKEIPPHVGEAVSIDETLTSSPQESCSGGSENVRDNYHHIGEAVSIDTIQPSVDEETSEVELLPNGGIQITYHGGLNDGIAEYIFSWCAEEYYAEYGLKAND